MLRILANNAAEKIRITAQTQDIIGALEANSASLLYRHGAELEHFCKKKLTAEGTRRKAVRFLQGTCAFRYREPAVRLKDTDAALSVVQGERACAVSRRERREAGHGRFPTGGRTDPRRRRESFSQVWSTAREAIRSPGRSPPRSSRRRRRQNHRRPIRPRRTRHKSCPGMKKPASKCFRAFSCLYLRERRL